MKKIQVGSLTIGEGEPLTIISGPCVIEGEKEALEAATALKEIFSKHPRLQFIFKSSYDKANRSSIHSYRGPGLKRGLEILAKIKHELNLPVFTDVHSPQEALKAAEVCDVIQIPAFLCRQTDLLVAAAQSGAVINIKKGQFMAPWDMGNVVEKVRESGSDQILLTERGVSFGYQNLVSDMRAIPIMKELGYPVLYDATHSVQLPGGLKDRSGGQREFIPTLSNAAIAAGCQGIYAEAHPDPANAKCDAACMLSFDSLPALLDQWERIYDAMAQTN